jgi:DNA-binding HxlR family transcriptional regulator
MDKLLKIKDRGDSCPVRKTAKIIEGKWTTLIVRELISGKKRYSQIAKSLVIISPKILTARLRFLEEKQMVKRYVYPTNPPTTEYELTKLGLEFKEVLNAMADFGKKL